MASNILGVDVSGLDVEAFLRTASLAYPLLALAWLALLLRVRRAGFLLLGVVLANAFVWLTTNYPLERLYALGASADRLNNLAMCQVVASGHSPLETWLVGQTHFGPHARPYVMLWTVLVASSSGFDPERLLRIYGFLPLVMACGFALSLYFGLGPERDGFWTPWQRAVVAGFATLMASAPTDFLGPYDVPWALTFLLKPNHALGLVLLPFVLRAFASIGGWRSRLAAALVLHLLAWVFALHMAYVAAGFVALVGLSLLFRRDEWRQHLADASVVVGLSALVIVPYVLWLVQAPRPAVADGGPTEIASVGAVTPMLLEVSLRNGLVFPAGLWGAWLAWRGGGRLGRVLAAQLCGASLLWLVYAGIAALGLTPRGPLGEVFEQPDEIFFWLRFLSAACAGLGAWDLLGRLRGASPERFGPAMRAAVLALVCLPASLPYWWNPTDTDRYFTQSRDPLSAELKGFATFLLRETEPSAILAGDRWLVRWAAALAGRRSLLSMGPPPPPDLERRLAVERTLLAGADPDAVHKAAAEYGITHIVVTSRPLHARKAGELDPERVEKARPELVRVYASDGPDFGSIRVYRILPAKT